MARLVCSISPALLDDCRQRDVRCCRALLVKNLQEVLNGIHDKVRASERERERVCVCACVWGGFASRFFFSQKKEKENCRLLAGEAGKVEKGRRGERR